MLGDSKAIQSPHVKIQDRNNKDPNQICIFASTLIPGRGDPIRNTAVGISTTTGTITFVGPQSHLPPSLASAPHITTHPATIGAAITRGLHNTLIAGITSVRDVSSYATEVAPLVKKKIILGPSIFGAGGTIGITGGSCNTYTLPVDFIYSRQGTSTSARNSYVEQCRIAVRQQIQRGARCIKIVATGGVLSTTDNPQYRQYSNSKLTAIIKEASLQGRSVAMHTHSKNRIMAAVRAGAHTIKHGSYINNKAAQLIASRGVTLITTRHIIKAGLHSLETLNPKTAAKIVAIAEAHLHAYKTAMQHGVKIALGTDIAGSNPASQTAHGKNSAEVVLAVKAGLLPLQAIKAGTVNSAETLGRLAPRKGLVQNPLKHIHLFNNPENIRGKLLWPLLPDTQQ
ncbi:hypothetical protein BJX63DRAFT_420783 [Aspergillus granulosus]|uniref:Amidohydrolase-related domain-containing protein n=1 Tax=Aspergillus granulosus TaxID=176169 RepID=A0ABR4HG22_9EURO